MVGAIDSHVYAGPPLTSDPCHLDPFQIASAARDAGMRALVFYDLFSWASGTAWMVNRHVQGIETFGGYIMNSCHGGLNPRAVKTALYIEDGCRFISFGVHCTYFSAAQASTWIDGKAVLLKDAFPKFAQEELPRAVQVPLEEPIPGALGEVLELIAAHPAVYLNTGWLSGPETLRLLDLAERFGIRKVLVAHTARRQLTVAQQAKAARRGAFLEASLSDGLPPARYYVEPEYAGGEPEPGPLFSATEWPKAIRAVGPAHFVLATGYGIQSASSPLQGMRALIAALLDNGFTPAEIRMLTATNPARLIGLDV